VIITRDELAFITRQGYSEDDIFDARGMPTQQWKAEVRSKGKTLVLGAPCQAAGHRLRTRSGHCAQCDPSKIAYQNRYHKAGYVYIAGSLSNRLIKIGTAIDCEQRENNLRNQGYGGIRDWRMLFHIKVANAGEVEQKALAHLKLYKSVRPFEKDGTIVEAGEILECSFSKAINAIATVIGEAALSKPWMSLSHKSYEF